MGVIMKKFFNYVLLSAMIASSVAFGISAQQATVENSNQPGKIKSALIYLRNKIVENKRTLAVVAGSGVIVAAAVVGCVVGYRHLESMKNFVNSLGQEKVALNSMIENFMSENAKLKDCLIKVNLDLENAKRLAAITESEKIALSLAKAAAEELTQTRADLVAKIGAKCSELDVAETMSIGKKFDLGINKKSLQDGAMVVGSLVGEGLKKGASLTWIGLKKSMPIIWSGIKNLAERAIGEHAVEGVDLGCNVASRLLNHGVGANYSLGSSLGDSNALQQEINYSLFASSL
jgi:hypothetical protein